MHNNLSSPLSIIICTWNSANHLPHCLSCLEAQTYQDFEVIVIDNGSKDGCVDDLEQKWPRLPLRLERWPENRGFAAANNFGARLARGKWLACLNADAFPEPDWAEQLLGAASNNPGGIFYSSRLLNANSPQLLDDAGDAYHISGLAWQRYHDCAANRYGLNREEVFSACAAAALYDREAFLSVGGFDEDFFSYYEDVDLGFRLRLLGFQCLYLPEAVVKHVGSASVGVKSDFAVYYWQRNFIWAFMKNMPFSLFWKALPAHLLANIIYMASSITKGKIWVVFKAKFDALRSLPKMIKKRKEIQKARKIDPSELLRVMEKGWFQPYWMAYNSRRIRRSARYPKHDAKQST
jgi:GT2 family glycosyltransferase